MSMYELWGATCAEAPSSNFALKKGFSNETDRKRKEQIGVKNYKSLVEIVPNSNHFFLVKCSSLSFTNMLCVTNLEKQVAEILVNFWVGYCCTDVLQEEATRRVGDASYLFPSQDNFSPVCSQPNWRN